MSGEKQLDLIEQPKKRGGARAGAGRKAERGDTKVVRIPERYKVAIDALITHLDKQRKLPSHESQVNVRDLEERLITLRFQTNLTSMNKKY